MPFAKTLRSLDAVRGRGTALTLGLVSLLVCFWLGWAAFSQVTLYEAAPARLEVARRSLEAISRQWDERLRRLQDLVEER